MTACERTSMSMAEHISSQAREHQRMGGEGA
jgi:hypothetical protein